MPAVSVIMATYNGARFIRQSINSLLAQSFADFELIVVDDGSTDATPAILAGIADPRLRVLRNETNGGVVAARNRAFAAARGRYVAMLDHDDLSRPTRLAHQVAYLDAHPDTVLLGTAAHTLTAGRLAPTNHPAHTTPALIAWLLHVANPLICASIMFRGEPARALGIFLRDDYEYADDFDFYHRMAGQGAVARLDEPLTIYRLHDANTFRQHHEKMTANAIKVLVPAYATWFGAEAGSAASMIVRHLSDGAPVPNAATLTRLTENFERLTQVFLTRAASENDRAAIVAHAHTLWRRMVRVTARAGTVNATSLLAARPLGFTPSAGDIGRLALGSLKLRARATPQPRRQAPPPAPRVGRLFDTVYRPVAPAPDQPPTLYVVVDTEAEFDWSSPFAHNLTDVTAMDDIERGQAVFDQYGLRPIYVIDFPVASQPRGYEPLRRILARNACVIGAHLHPWTTPPFEEDLSSRNSYPGNLPPALEAEKLARLIETIATNFGIAPQFYKAGRYGFGPATAATLASHGIKVDLSILPGADLRRKGGPDFRHLEPIPYTIDGTPPLSLPPLSTPLLSLPMTRAEIGLAPSPQLARLARAPFAQRLHVPAILARAGMNETVTLTPEGVTAAEQIRLIKTLLKRGQRIFVLHYHSPSLSPGHTPYVRNEPEARAFIENLQTVCRYFFTEIAGLPGNPNDLLPPTIA